MLAFDQVSQGFCDCGPILQGQNRGSVAGTQLVAQWLISVSTVGFHMPASHVGAGGSLTPKPPALLLLVTEWAPTVCQCSWNPPSSYR